MTVSTLVSSAVAASEESIAALASRFNRSVEAIGSVYRRELAAVSDQARVKDYLVLLALRSVRDQLSKNLVPATPV